MFVDREFELAHLRGLGTSGHAEFFVLYGRRRLGKTELLRAFCAGKPNVFFVATLSSDRDQLSAFSQEVWRFDHTQVAEGFTFPSWEAAFRSLADLPGRPIVVLDEFTYLLSGNRAIPSILQKVWDDTLRHTRIFLILCGSYVGMMEREVLDYGAPLYGRRTGSYLLPPLEIRAVAAFFPRYAPVEQIEAWAVLGGLPYYLQAFSDEVDIFTNIRAHILDPMGTLYNEPLLLLMEELREPRNYLSILRALAQGRTRLNEIAQAAGVGDSAITARYLDTLQRLRVVRRTVPATESQPHKSKKGLYRIADAFLRFWFRFVHPYQGALSLGLADAVLAQRVRPAFDQFVSYAFEEAAAEYIARLARSGELPFLPERIGAWWDGREEIDVVAISDSEGAVLVGECKWWGQPVGVNVLVDLERKAEVLNGSRRWPKVSYVLFSRSGFMPDLQIVASARAVRLVQAADLFR